MTEHSTQHQSLTDKDYWSNYWENQNPFSGDQKRFTGKYEKELLIPFNKSLSIDKNLSVLEIGGYPGDTLLALALKYNLKKIGILDYYIDNPEKIINHFRIENYDLEIYKKDLFKDNLSGIKYDVVYSLGFAEHYSDIEKTTKKHLECLEEKGILIIGMPVFLGINKWLAQIFSPKNLNTHLLTTMHPEPWVQVSKKLDLKIIFNGYVGGFNPNAHHRLEQPSIFKRIAYVLLHKIFAPVWKWIPWTTRINSRYWSFYYYIAFCKN